MKVVHVYKDYYPPVYGGIEQHMHDLVHGLSGIEFTILTASRSRRAKVDWDHGVRVIRAAEFGRPASAPIAPGWFGALRSVDADVFHFHMPNPFAEAALIAGRSRVPLVVTFHADVARRPLYTLYRPVQDRLLAAARSIVVSSQRLLETSPVLGRHARRANVIPFGTDVSRWRPRPPLADTLRARFRPPLVLFLGRLAHYKGLDLLIEASRSLDATVVIVGHGPERKRLEALARRSRSGRIAFVGSVPNDERGGYYHAADVFVLPSTSRLESFGIAMLEAMACGTPVVSTEVMTGTSWVNRHGETGLVVPPNDARALHEGIGRLLADEARRRAYGEEAARRVASCFRKEPMLADVASLYAAASGARQSELR